MCTSLWLFRLSCISTIQKDINLECWLSINELTFYYSNKRLQSNHKSQNGQYLGHSSVCLCEKECLIWSQTDSFIWTLNNYNSYKQDSIRAWALHSHWYNLYYSLSWFKMTWDNCSNTHQFEIAKFMNSNYNQPWLWLWWLLYLNLYPFFISSYW